MEIRLKFEFRQEILKIHFEFEWRRWEIPKIPAALQWDVLDPPSWRVGGGGGGESGASMCERFGGIEVRFQARGFVQCRAHSNEESAGREVPCELERFPSNARAFQRGFVSVRVEQDPELRIYCKLPESLLPWNVDAPCCSFFLGQNLYFWAKKTSTF